MIKGTKQISFDIKISIQSLVTQTNMMVLSKRLNDLRVWKIIYLLSVILILFACDDESQITRCTNNDDCRDGYSCDLEVYVGECVLRRQVQACGSAYCVVGVGSESVPKNSELRMVCKYLIKN